MKRKQRKIIKLSTYPWNRYPFTYKDYIDKQIADHVYDTYWDLLQEECWN